MKKVKQKKSMKKTTKVRIIVLVVVILISLLICGFVVKKYIDKTNDSGGASEVKVNDTIDDFGYELTENATEYYKELFNKLKTLLADSNYDEEEYAKLVSQMFVADFYNLDNKVTNSDIGGTDFIATDYVDNFKLAAQNTIYKTIESNVYGDRKQELPKVLKASIDSITKEKFTYNNTNDSNAYKVKISINYETDMGYPDDVTLILIHNDKKLEIAKVD